MVYKEFMTKYSSIICIVSVWTEDVNIICKEEENGSYIVKKKYQKGSGQKCAKKKSK